MAWLESFIHDVTLKTNSLTVTTTAHKKIAVVPDAVPIKEAAERLRRGYFIANNRIVYPIYYPMLYTILYPIYNHPISFPYFERKARTNCELLRYFETFD